MSALERSRGYQDAVAGHGPALFDGDYMIGYRRAKADMGEPLSHLPTKEEEQRRRVGSLSSLTDDELTALASSVKAEQDARRRNRESVAFP